jgi:hypothetical protein
MNLSEAANRGRIKLLNKGQEERDCGVAQR